MQRKLEKIKNFFERSTFSQMHEGFSLLEVLVAMFIFMLMMTVSVSVFISIFHARNSARISQKSIEEARTTMEMVAKNIRMSTKVQNIGGNAKKIRMFNNSQGQCVAYESANDGKFRSVKYYPDPNITTDPSYPDCSVVPSFDQVLLSSGADVEFVVSADLVGKVTIRMKVTTGSAVNVLQTTVSLRGYQEINY